MTTEDVERAKDASLWLREHGELAAAEAVDRLARRVEEAAKILESHSCRHYAPDCMCDPTVADLAAALRAKSGASREVGNNGHL